MDSELNCGVCVLDAAERGSGERQGLEYVFDSTSTALQRNLAALTALLLATTTGLS